jgi:hypothetical protein
MDNKFGAVKANLLYEVVSGSQLTGLTFLNRASNIDLEADEYSNF